MASTRLTEPHHAPEPRHPRHGPQRGRSPRTGHPCIMALLRIGQLAKELGTTPKTLRFYEQIGLLGHPARSESGYRLYDRRAAKQARLVLGLRRLRLSIGELKALFAAEPRQRSLRQRLLALMDENIRKMELALNMQQGRRDELAARHQMLLSTPRTRPPDCICDALGVDCACGQEPPRER